MDLRKGEIVVDCFAGGGGASTGIEAALNSKVDIAINHSPQAVAVHEANHPSTKHYCQDIYAVDPIEAAAGRPVGLLWASPDCTHHSRAKGGKPRSKKIRGLAWVVTKWAELVRPRTIFLENVVEFETWGPLRKDGRPDKRYKGKTFKKWIAKLESLGYEVDWQPMMAADFGTPTSRRRLFIVARCDGLPITWPDPTHSEAEYLPASTIIDWSVPAPSIFTRKRPLADKTLERIALGIQRFVIDTGDPFIISHYGQSVGRGIDRPLPTVTAGGGGHQGLVTPFLVPLTHQGTPRVHSLKKPIRTVTAANRGEFALAAPILVQTGYGERRDQSPRILDLSKPLGTVVAGGTKHNVGIAWLTKHYTGVVGTDLRNPVGTVTAQDHHALTVALMRRFAGSTSDPAITIHGDRYVIADIGMRMLQPRELFNAQGFAPDYEIDIEFNGKPLTKTSKIALAGNSVCPPLAAALVHHAA